MADEDLVRSEGASSTDDAQLTRRDFLRRFVLLSGAAAVLGSVAGCAVYGPPPRALYGPAPAAVYGPPPATTSTPEPSSAPSP